MVRHWIVTVAARAGLDRAADLEVGIKAPAAVAWASVAERCRIGEEELARHVAGQFRLDLADLAGLQAHALKLIPEAVARRHQVVPLRQDDRFLVIATSDPTDMEMEQAIGFVSGRRTIFEIAPPAAIGAAIEAHYGAEPSLASFLAGVDNELADAVRVIEGASPEEVSAQEVEAAPVVKVTSIILREAVESRASDIHVEPGRTDGMVRFRVDGVLRTFTELPMSAFNRVISRIKILGKLDIADRVRPQDGRARLQIGERSYDLRISTVPTRDSEKAVIRILDPMSAVKLDQLTISTRELRRIRHLTLSPHGIVVVTGPTGSGKTTLLYAAIRELALGEVNVMTVEDPIEYELGGVTQIQVDPKRSVTFASALRAILRQDPDIVFVGEIRDQETAEVAVHASQTGHLVLATLHTNNAVGAVPRLADLGLQPAAIAATLRGVVAQRLLRRVCPRCATPVGPDRTPAEDRLAGIYRVEPAVRAVGCPHCAQTGYYGRLPVVEVLTATPQIEELLSRRASEAELERAGVAGGMRPMLEAALERVAAGETTLQELERVLGEIGLEPAGQGSAQQPHVLLVDDDAENRLLARALLEQEGFRVSEAVDGVDALERIRGAADLSLVVLDLDMPRLGGREVLARVRAGGAAARLAVIVLTGNIDADAEVWLMEEGADDYIRKPIEPRRFVARVRAALRRAGALPPASTGG